MDFRSLRTEFKLHIQWFRAWRSFPIREWVQAALLYREGKFREARAQYERGLERHAQHPAAECARLDYAYCLFRLGEIRRARQELRHVVLNAPHLRESHLRLAKLHLWCAEFLEAAWVLRRALRHHAGDAELSSLFLIAVAEQGGPDYLLQDALSAVAEIEGETSAGLLVETARSLILIDRGDVDAGRRRLRKVALRQNAPIEAVIGFAAASLTEGRAVLARQHLQKALSRHPGHPRVLSLLAETYLRSETQREPELARQLALVACQQTEWLSPREIHVLAEAYTELGDVSSAFLVASKARDLGTNVLSRYRRSRQLDQLLSNLVVEPQASSKS